MKKLILLAVFWDASSGIVVNRPLAFELTGEQIKALSPIWAAYIAGGMCNKEIDQEVAGRFLRSQIGDNTSFNAQQVVEAGFLIIGFQHMQMTFGAVPTTKSAMAVHCTDMMKTFGPLGTSIPGILK